MSADPSALLVYGVALGHRETGWNLAEAPVNEWGDRSKLHLPWCDERQPDAPLFYEELVLQLHGGIPGAPSWRTPSEAEDLVKRHYGVELFHHGSEYALARILGIVGSKHKVEWGDTERLDLGNLADRAREGAWAAKIERACQAVGVTPLEPPGWVLASLYF